MAEPSAAAALLAALLLFYDIFMLEVGAAAAAVEGAAGGALLDTVAGVIIFELKSGLPYVLKTIYETDKKAQIVVIRILAVKDLTYVAVLEIVE